MHHSMQAICCTRNKRTTAPSSGSRSRACWHALACVAMLRSTLLCLCASCLRRLLAAASDGAHAAAFAKMLDQFEAKDQLAQQLEAITQLTVCAWVQQARLHAAVAGQRHLTACVLVLAS